HSVNKPFGCGRHYIPPNRENKNEVVSSFNSCLIADNLRVNCAMCHKCFQICGCHSWIKLVFVKIDHIHFVTIFLKSFGYCIQNGIAETSFVWMIKYNYGPHFLLFNYNAKLRTE